MVLSCIAMGVPQILTICFVGKVRPDQLRYQEVPSTGKIFEAVPMDHLRKHLFRLLCSKPGFTHKAGNSRTVGGYAEDM